MISTIFVIFGLIILGFGGTIVALTVDWRGLFQKYWGDDYHHGEAVYIINGRHTYFHSELWHEGPHACSYWRTTKLNGVKVTYDDIVPNPDPGVPMQFDSNGRRMYWPIEGNAICSNKEDSSYQFTNYPPEMMSSDMADRIGIGYGHSVKTQGGGPGIGLLIIGGVVLVAIIVGVLFATGTFNKKPAPAPAAAANATANQQLPPNAVIGVPYPTPGGK